MISREKCAECNGDLVTKVYTHTEKVGPWTAIDRTTMVPQCENCGAPRLTLDELEKYQLIAAKTVLCENKLDGAVVRYARKALGLTQKELGLLLDYGHETISKWENEKESVPRSAGAALVGLLYRAIDGEKPEEMVEKAEMEKRGTAPENTDHEIVVFRKAV
jgi:DNA-binding transcriptional regulator YiaG